MAGHAVRLGGDGSLVIVRTSPPEDRAHLLRAIQSLRAAAGAGAVEIVEVHDDEEHVELVLAFAGRSPEPPMSASVLAPVAAAIATHLTDLHLRRIAHGAVRPEHVLVDAGGSVRLCGFASVADASSADDVRAFGALVSGLLDGDDRGVTADALRAHADRCGVEDASVRPTMAAIAASLAGIDGGGRAIAAVPRVTHTHRRWPLGIAAALVLAVVLVLAAVPRASRAEVQRDVAERRPSTTTTTSTTTTIVRAARVWPTTLEGDGSTWQLGDADDQTFLGDWNCDGVATPALLERPSGELWVIDAWPVGDQQAARFVQSIAGAVDATVEQRGRCDRLVVETHDGTTTTPSLAPA